MNRFTTAAALFALLATPRCDALDQRQLLAEVLEEFAFSCVQSKENHTRCIPTDRPLAMLPRVLDDTKQYVLNKRLPGGVSELGLTVLPERLRSSGCQVLAYPKGPKDLLFGDAGEPVFFIRFRCDGVVMELKNRYNPRIEGDPELRSTWSVSDLIVRTD